MKDRSKSPRAASRSRRKPSPPPVAVEPIAPAIAADDLPTFELAKLLDEVRATVLALLAALQQKEKDLRQQASETPAPGIDAGLSDIRVMRRWADRTLQTIGVLENGKSGELHVLLDELTEFREILHDHDGALPTSDPGVVRGG